MLHSLLNNFTLLTNRQSVELVVGETKPAIEFVGVPSTRFELGGVFYSAAVEGPLEGFVGEAASICHLEVGVRNAPAETANPVSLESHVL